MNEFATLIYLLSSTNSVLDKKVLLADYFSNADDQDKLWALALFTGRKPKRSIRTTQLKKWCFEFTDIQDWLFDASYQMVGDLAETISLLICSKSNSKIQLNDQEQISLSDSLKKLKSLSLADEDFKKSYIISQWEILDQNECFVFNKLITGGFRIGVSDNLISSAIAKILNKPLSEIQHRLSGNWTPENISWDELLFTTVEDQSKPYPFYLCHPVVESKIDFLPDEWYAENKWDGIRGQIIKRKNEIFIWSRGEELMNEQFPELVGLNECLPNGTVLDGEIICLDKSKETINPLPFSLLQKRIGKKKPGKKLLQDAPVMFITYDLIEWEEKDIRSETLIKRRNLLESLIESLNADNIILSPLIEFKNTEDLKIIRSRSHKEKTEGIMLKRKISFYLSGRKKGDWWKWKTDPFNIDCVLLYAQAGHGRRGGLYTDYTFAVKDGDRLVTFAKAYSGLTDEEIKEVDAFIKKNAVEKFGPVRTVKPELVFELAFEGIQESKRHKSGVALRFPRISRWRKDKSVNEINTLDDLKSLLNQTD
ncbi:MAG: ATP-dependent DNA ligase [Bacteroidota bacterium]